MKEGRWVSAPPFGYKRGRDEQDKPLIVPDPKSAPLVREAFQYVVDHPDLAIEEIRRRFYRKGMKVSKSRWHVILKNACYAGRITVPAYKDEPERTVEALHAPIVPPPVFDRVQVLLSPKKKERKTRPAEGFELRGHLVCPVCGGRLTASRSTSRSGQRYGYYHCLGRGTNGRTDDGLGGSASSRGHARCRADEAGDVFYRSLLTITVSPAVRAAYELVLQDLTRDDVKVRGEKIRLLKGEISQFEDKLFAADEKLVEGILPADAYARLRGRYDEEIAALRLRLRELEEGAGIASVITHALDVFSDLAGVWKRATPEGRAALVGSIWPSGLIYSENGYGTTLDSPIVRVFRGKKAENSERHTRDRAWRPVRWALQDRCGTIGHEHAVLQEGMVGQFSPAVLDQIQSLFKMRHMIPSL